MKYLSVNFCYSSRFPAIVAGQFVGFLKFLKFIDVLLGKKVIMLNDN